MRRKKKHEESAPAELPMFTVLIPFYPSTLGTVSGANGSSYGASDMVPPGSVILLNPDHPRTVEYLSCGVIKRWHRELQT